MDEKDRCRFSELLHWLLSCPNYLDRYIFNNIYFLSCSVFIKNKKV